MIGFHNSNENRAYPLIALTAARRVGGRDWPDGAIADCGFVVDAAAGEALLTRVRVLKPKVFFDFFLGGIAAAIEADVDDPPGTVRRVRDGRVDGYLVTGRDMPHFARFADTPTGHYLLSPDSPLEPTRVQWLHDAFVTELWVANRKGNEAETTLAATGFTGEVGFSPGAGSFIAADAASGRLILGTDPGNGTPCWPEAEDDECAGFVTTINGSGAGTGGDFILAGEKGVEVRNYPEEHRIVIDFTKGLTDAACVV